jgi:RNA ligase
LPAIEGCEGFKVFEREQYTVINYFMMGSDTFPSVLPAYDAELEASELRKAALRRECRGLIFDKSGKLIRRAYHKFFNLGEREEVLEENVDLTYKHMLLEKLDGSMVTPLPLETGIRWATKMGITEVSMQAEVFVAKNPHFEQFSKTLIAEDLLPIFEWCSPKNHIVIKHPQDNLILTALRYQTNGHYFPYDSMKAVASYHGIPFVRELDFPEYTEQIYEAENTEGVVVTFHNGHRVKVKTDWYTQIHRAKDGLTQEKRVLELILDEKLDDVLPFLPPDDKAKLLQYVDNFNGGIKNLVTHLMRLRHSIKEMGIDRKAYALNMSPMEKGIINSVMFSAWEKSDDDLIDIIIGLIKKNLGSQTNVDKVRPLWNDEAYWVFKGVEE